LGNGAQGRDRTTDTAIFSRVLDGLKGDGRFTPASSPVTHPPPSHRGAPGTPARCPNKLPVMASKPVAQTMLSKQAAAPVRSRTAG